MSPDCSQAVSWGSFVVTRKDPCPREMRLRRGWGVGHHTGRPSSALGPGWLPELSLQSLGKSAAPDRVLTLLGPGVPWRQPLLCGRTRSKWAGPSSGQGTRGNVHREKASRQQRAAGWGRSRQGGADLQEPPPPPAPSLRVKSHRPAQCSPSAESDAESFRNRRPGLGRPGGVGGS